MEKRRQQIDFLQTVEKSFKTKRHIETNNHTIINSRCCIEYYDFDEFNMCGFFKKWKKQKNMAIFG